MKHENDEKKTTSHLSFTHTQGIAYFVIFWSLLMLALAGLWDYFELKQYWEQARQYIGL